MKEGFGMNTVGDLMELFKMLFEVIQSLVQTIMSILNAKDGDGEEQPAE